MAVPPAAEAPLAALASGLGLLAAVAGLFTIAFSFASAFAAWRLRRRCLAAARRGGDRGRLPPVTVLKPIKGLDDGMYENLASFLAQDYPDFQVLFTLQDPLDPALDVLRRLREGFPAADMDIVVSKSRVGYNPKVNNLSNAQAFIKHGVLLISDSDIRVGPGFLRRAAAALKDPDVGLVTCFYRSSASRTLGGALDSLSVNAHFLPQALAAGLLGGMRFAMGAAMLVRREAFEAAGGFGALGRHLADDFILGAAVSAAGWRVEFADALVDSVPGDPSVPEHLAHLSRWARTIRACQPGGYAGLILLHGFALVGLHLLLFGPGRGMSALWAAVAGARMLATAWMHGACLAGADLTAGPAAARSARALLAEVLLVPVSDLAYFAVWAAGFRSRTVLWRGERYHIAVGGRLVPERRRTVAAPAT